jgi:hypothetical protein
MDLPMESALYLKSVMLVLIVSFTLLSDNIVVIGNAKALPWSNNSYSCSSSTNNNNNNVPYHRALNQTLSVRGIVNLSDSSIVLKPSMILPSSIFTTRPVDSSFAIDLLDGKGRVLAHYPIDIIESKARVKEWKDIGYISEAVPYHPCTAKITINKDVKELVSQVVSPNVPKIISINVTEDKDGHTNPRLIFPRTSKITIQWQAQDLDKDQLTYSLLYSNDGGRTWPITVADDIAQKLLTLNTDSLPGNSVNLSRFRVIATDGVNTDVRDSDPFSIPILNIGH